MNAIPLPPAKLHAVADTRQVFDGDAAPGAFGLSNDAFADAMIGVFPESSLPLMLSGHRPTDVLRSFATTLSSRHGLAELKSAFCISNPTRIKPGRRSAVAVAVTDDVGNAHIDADEIRCRGLGSIGQVHSHEQEPLTVLTKHEVALPFSETETVGLIAPHDERDKDSAIESEETHAVQALEAHDPLVEGHGSVLPKSWEFGFVALIGFTNLGNAANGHLGRKAEAVPEFSIVKFLESDLVGEPASKRFASKPGRGLVESSNGRLELTCLVDAGEKLNL